MSNDSSGGTPFDNLRKDAVDRRQRGQHSVPERFTIDPKTLSLSDAQHLIEELQIYHVELEIQNEELRDTQQALESSRDRFSGLYHNSPVGYATVDQQGIVREANETLAALLRMRRQRIMARPFSFLVVRPHADAYASFLHSLFEHRQPQSCELDLKGANGSLHSVELTGHVQLTEDDQLYCQLVVTDIAARKRLEQTQRLLKTALEASSDGVAISDMRESSFPLVYASPCVGTLLDCDVEQLVGQSWLSLYAQRVEQVAGLEETIASGQSAEIALRFSRANGSQSWYEVTLYPLQDDLQRTTYFVHVLRDITQRVQAEEALRQAQHIDSVGALAGGVAKQFNRLVSTVISQVSVAQMMSNSNNEAALSKALDAAQQAQALSRQMLAYAGRDNGQLGALDLNALVVDTTALLHVTLPARQTLTTELTTTQLLVTSTRGQIQQIILNLLLNASEAIVGVGTIKVTTSAVNWLADSADLADQWILENALPAQVACLQIRDSGSGINSDDLRTVFDPFYSTKDSGRGLGLAATLGAVRANGGALGISTSSSGTTVTVLLPLENV